MSFASNSWLENDEDVDHPLNDLLFDWFKCLFLDEHGSEPSDYVQRCALADKSMQFYYYAQPQELAARAFEACIQDQLIKNTFLVQGTKQTVEAKVGIYPTDQHRDQSSLRILEYFKHLGRALSSA